MESSCTVSLIWGVGGTACFEMIDFVYNLIIMGSLGVVISISKLVYLLFTFFSRSILLFVFVIL